MADTYTIVNGHNLKLIDNGDGTFSHAVPAGDSTGAKQDEILDKMSPKTHYLLSADTKPTSAEKGESVFEIDTQTVYMWNGNEWVVI